MIIEIMGPSGVGKTFYSKKVENNLGFSRIKPDVKKVIAKKIIWFPSALILTMKLKPRPSKFLKCLVHVVFLRSYKNLNVNNTDKIITDQGILFHFSKIQKYCQKEYTELFSFFFQRKKFAYPNIVLEIVAKKETLYERKKKRNPSKEYKIHKHNKQDFTSLSKLNEQTIDKLDIKHLKYYSENEDSQKFLNFFQEHIS